MKHLVRLLALLVLLAALAYLVYGAYWVNPGAFRTKLKLLMGSFREDERPGERGRLCDFESPDDLAGWKASACRIDLSAGTRSAGNSGGRISFDGGTGFASAKLEDYVFGPGEHRDWSSFERLSFWLKNGGEEKVDLDIQVKDSSERRYHHLLRLGPRGEERVSMELVSLSDTVDLRRIVSIIIGAYGKVGEFDLFVDEIVLEGDGDPMGKPFITFVNLDVPSRVRRGTPFTLSAHLRAEKPVPNDYRIFLHIYPESQASIVETSGREGLINADHDPPVKTSLWEVVEDEPVGTLEIFIPEDNPPGRYCVEMGLFNQKAGGRPERDIEYPGAFDFSGSYPKCRYTNPEIRGYVVGRLNVS